MEKLTNRSRQVVDKKMTFAEQIYLPAIVGGMWITLKHFSRSPQPLNILKRNVQDRRYIADSMY